MCPLSRGWPLNKRFTVSLLWQLFNGDAQPIGSMQYELQLFVGQHESRLWTGQADVLFALSCRMPANNKNTGKQGILFVKKKKINKAYIKVILRQGFPVMTMMVNNF